MSETKKFACQSVDESIKCANNFDPGLFTKSEKICLAEKFAELKFQNPGLKESLIVKEMGVTFQFMNKILRELNLKPERKKYQRLKYSFDNKSQQFVKDQYGNYFFNVKTKTFDLIPQAPTKITLTTKRNILASKHNEEIETYQTNLKTTKRKKNTIVAAAGLNDDKYEEEINEILAKR